MGELLSGEMEDGGSWYNGHQNTIAKNKLQHSAAPRDDCSSQSYCKNKVEERSSKTPHM